MNTNFPVQASQKLLVMLPGPMGDAILAVPALRRLRKACPDTRITFLAETGNRDILAGCPFCDAWLTCDKKLSGKPFHDMAATIRAGGFDAAILMTNSFRSALLMTLAAVPRRIGYRRQGRGPLLTHSLAPAALMGQYVPLSMLDYYHDLIDFALQVEGSKAEAAPNRELQLFTTETDEHQAAPFFARNNIAAHDRVAILVPGGAFGPSKLWPVERFAAVSDRLVEEEYKVILSCAPTGPERRLADTFRRHARRPFINLLDEHINLGALKAVIKRSNLMVANDTGPCHIAAAFNVPLVTLFGPTDPRWTATGYTGEIRLRRDVDCGPCQLKLCPLDHRCLQGIGLDDVLRAIQTITAPDSAGRTPQTEQINGIWHVRADPGRPNWGHYYHPCHESFLRLPDRSGLILQDYQPELQRKNLTTLESVFTFTDGDLLTKPGLRNRERMRIHIAADENTRGVIYLKRYHPPTLAARLQRRLTRRSRAAVAEYDFHAALKLAEIGVPVPRPLACGAENRGLRERRSFVMLEGLPNGDALERLLPDRTAQQKNYPLLTNRRPLLRRLAELARTLHTAGYYHRDLYLSHIFLCKDAAGREELCLIDLQRVFRPVLFCRRWQVKDLAQLYYSARQYFTRTDTLRFLLEYLQHDRLHPSDKKLIRAVLHKTRRIARHDRNRNRRLNQPQVGE